MKNVLALLTMVLAAMLAATPALAQGAAGDQYDPGASGGEVSATGVLQDRGEAPANRTDLTHFVTEEQTGITWFLQSEDPEGVLDPYNGQRVTVYGTNATAPGPGDDEPVISVSKIEAADGGNAVTVTFELTVDGPIPEGQNFGVDYPVGGQQPADVPLCTTDPGLVGGFGPRCEPGGTYSGSVEVPAEEPVEYALQRYEAGAEIENFLVNEEVFTEDATVEASYSFSGNETPEGPTPETFRGYADDVGLAGMRVDSDESGEPCAGGASWQISFAEAGTEFFVRRDGGEYPITIHDVGNGDFVEVSYTLGPDEALPQICPTPISADSVTVLEDETPGNEPPGKTAPEAPEPTPENPDPREEPVRNPESPTNDPAFQEGPAGKAEKLAISVLPDTGGVPVALVGIALFSAAGGLLIRHISK